MMKEKRFVWLAITGLVLLAAFIFVNASMARAQYWQALPPYNLLWPLWSPALSPVDPGTGLATPLLTQISNNTILPVQPALVWDPAQSFPWLLYNIPSVLGGGLTYFAPYYGFNPWPPSYLSDPVTGAPVPTTLPAGFELLPPTELDDFGLFFNAANTTYAILYPPSIYNYSFSSFLTPAEVWGLPLL
ncbi:MAG: hypothetical protein ACMUIL_08330 [bacterium]